MTPKLRDLFGGISAALVLLPRNMAFGMLIFLPFGPEYAPLGVAAGIVSLIVGNMVSSLRGSVKVMTVSTFSLSALIMMSMNQHLVDQLTASGQANVIATVLPLCFIATLLAGFFQIMFGFFRLGNLAKYIPHPVLSGVLNGTGLAIISSQLHVILTDGATVENTMSNLWLIAVAVTTIAASFIGPRLYQGIPSAFYGIAGGTAAYYGFQMFSDADIGTLVGSLPDTMFSLNTATAMVEVTGDVQILTLMPTVALYALAIGAADTMRSALSCLIVDLKTRERSDFNQELIAEGLGNMLAAPLGAITSTGNATGALTNLNHGGTTGFSRFSIGIALLGTVAFLSTYLAAIPIVVLAGVMIVMTLVIMDFNFVQDIRRQFRFKDQSYTRINSNLALEFFTAFVVVGVDLFAALLFGLLISIAMFVLNMTKQVVRGEYNGAQLHSNVVRNQIEQQLLEPAARNITLLELEGVLFFGTAEQLRDHVDPLLQSETKVIILDVRRVSQIDLTAVEILSQIQELCADNNKSFALSSITEAIAVERFQELLPALQAERFNTFMNAADALAWAEELVLRNIAGLPQNSVELCQVEAVRYLSSYDVDTLKTYLTEHRCRAGEHLIREGSRDQAVYFITEGEAVVGAQRHDTFLRYCTVRAGALVGEASLFKKLPRSADVIAQTDLVCYCLRLYELKKLRLQHPGIAYEFVVGLTLRHGDLLRQENERIALPQ